MQIQSQFLDPKACFRIEGLFYKITDIPPIKGDLVLDLTDGMHGVHDGEYSNLIAVRDGSVIAGVEVQYVRKLEPTTLEEMKNVVGDEILSESLIG